MLKVQRSRALVATTFVAIAALALTGSAVLAASKTVEIKEENGQYSFQPGMTTVTAGDSVMWQNASDAPHTVTSDGAGPLGGDIAADSGSYSFTFETAGSYAYHCNIHPAMQGTVVVEAGTGGGEPTQPPTDMFVPTGSSRDGEAPLPLLLGLSAYALALFVLATRRLTSARMGRR